jgi:CMP-N,N'-diacetyllegionaminic acid synthase
MLTLAVIPARGRSRGLPGKHLRLIGGEPMIARTIRAALDAKRIDRVVVSTDDPAIAGAARDAGAEVPYLRPDELAADETPTFPVIDHAVRAVESDGEAVSVVVTLQPTSPLRTAEQIDAAIALLDPPRVRSVVSVTALDLPASVVGGLVGGRYRSIPMPPGTDTRRQGSPGAVRLTGAIYVTTRGLLAEGRLIDDAPAALLTAASSAIDVDDAQDLRAARRAVAGRR